VNRKSGGTESVICTSEQLSHIVRLEREAQLGPVELGGRAQRVGERLVAQVEHGQERSPRHMSGIPPSAVT